MNTVDDHQPASTVVRRAAVADVPAMVMIGRQFIRETRIEDRGVYGNPNKLHASLESSIGSDLYGVFVAERGDAIVGVASVIQFTTYFSETPMAIELFWWVRPEFRGGSAALKMMKAMEDWAWGAGCATFSMVDVVAVDSPAKSIYERRGFELFERTWIKGNPSWQ